MDELIKNLEKAYKTIDYIDRSGQEIVHDVLLEEALDTIHYATKFLKKMQGLISDTVSELKYLDTDEHIDYQDMGESLS